MEYLSPLDGAFLDAETATQALNVVAVLVLDSGATPPEDRYRVFRDRIEERYPAIPPCRRRLRRLPTGQAVWVEDAEVHVDRHLHHAVVGRPGGFRELADVTAHVAAGQLPRDRPLWECWFVEGLEGDKTAAIAKVHHCAIDGVSGITALAEFFDLAPDAPTEHGTDWRPQPAPGLATVAGASLGAAATWPFTFARSAFALGRSWLGDRRKRDDSVPRTPFPFTAPRLALNHALSRGRSVALTSVPLDDVKRIRKHLGVTVNDVVVALCTGALRSYLTSHDERLERTLTACVPTSERGLEDQRTGNKFSTLFYALPVHLADPVERIMAIQRSANAAKDHHERVGTGRLESVTGLVPPGSIRWIMRAASELRLPHVVPPFANLFISNVRGPDFPLYVAGARVDHIFPLGPLFEAVPLNVTVVTYLDRVSFGFIGCAERVPDIQSLADAVSGALVELQAATGTREASIDLRDDVPEQAPSREDDHAGVRA